VNRGDAILDELSFYLGANLPLRSVVSRYESLSVEEKARIDDVMGEVLGERGGTFIGVGQQIVEGISGGVGHVAAHSIRHRILKGK